MAIGNVRFETHVKWYFTALFRAHMLAATQDDLDLWERNLVEYNFDAIRDKINRDQNQPGVMPPSSLWGHTWDVLTRDRFLKDFDEWKSNGFPA